jgi:hypothetical protein
MEELLTLAKQAGPFGCVFLLTALVWLNELRKSQKKEYDALLERYLSQGGDVRQALKDIKDMIAHAVEKAK